MTGEQKAACTTPGRVLATAAMVLRAPTDRNGNPRGALLVLHNGTVIDAAPVERMSVRPYQRHDWPEIDGQELPVINTTAAFVRDMVNQHGRVPFCKLDRGATFDLPAGWSELRTADPASRGPFVKLADRQFMPAAEWLVSEYQGLASPGPQPAGVRTLVAGRCRTMLVRPVPRGLLEQALGLVRG